MTWSTDTNVWHNDCNTWSLSQIDCQLLVGVCQWSGDFFRWSGAPNIWSQCLPPVPPSVVPSQAGVDATTLIPQWLEEPWNPYRAGEINKRKRFIKLICKVKNQTYEEEKGTFIKKNRESTR